MCDMATIKLNVTLEYNGLVESRIVEPTIQIPVINISEWKS